MTRDYQPGDKVKLRGSGRIFYLIEGYAEGRSWSLADEPYGKAVSILRETSFDLDEDPIPPEQPPVSDRSDLIIKVDRIEGVILKLEDRIEALEKRLAALEVKAAPARAPLPCPFCGGGDVSMNGHVKPDGWFFVGCADCAADGPRQRSPESATAEWNRRAKP